MKVVKFSLSLVITVVLIYMLDNRWTIRGTPIPPLGKFLDPYHGFWQNIERQNDLKSRALNIPGLKDSVNVVYDSLLIPHIFANNEDDLYLTQGYITAMHRLWQMEVQLHSAAGRISEIIGESGLEYDRRQRRLGMVYGAERAIETMMKDSSVNHAITKYTAGVNAYINTLIYKNLPFEYKLLDYKPETYTALKSGLLLKNLSQTLNMGDNDFEMTNALNYFGKDVADLLYFSTEKPTGDPIVSNPGGWKFNPVTFDTIPLAIPDALIKLKPIGEKTKGIGSNNWAVSGSKTVSGSPILCNDPHLNLTFPSIWYVVHLQTPSQNVMGASLPGSPMIVIGFNDSISWGVTNAQRDLVDWYQIQFKDETQNEYRSDDSWKPVKKRIEKFIIRGKDSFYDTVVYTHHGPVVYDKSFHSESEKLGYAFRWLAHDGSEELKTLKMLNKGKNYNDYTNALSHWSGPAQNFVFSAVNGDIAIRVQGKFPVRRKDEGKYILDGSKTSTEWKAFIPFEHNVHSKNPLRGFVSSANQFPADSTYPYYIRSNDYETFRNKRINHVLTENNKISPEDMMKLQNDNFNIRASESLPLMLSLLDKSAQGDHEKKIIESLTTWNYVSGAESLAAPYYEAWWNLLFYTLWDEMENDSLSLEYPTDFNTIHLMKTQPDFSLFDIQSTKEKENLQIIVNMAFSQSVKNITAWEVEHNAKAKWADYKDTFIRHLLRIDPLSKHVSVGGNSGIVNAAGPKSGPSWRMIVSMEKTGVNAWGVYPAGQSGNPGSMYYDNMVDTWANGKYYKLAFDKKQNLKGKSLFAIQFNPSEK